MGSVEQRRDHIFGDGRDSLPVVFFLTGQLVRTLRNDGKIEEERGKEERTGKRGQNEEE